MLSLLTNVAAVSEHNVRVSDGFLKIFSHPLPNIQWSYDRQIMAGRFSTCRVFEGWRRSVCRHSAVDNHWRINDAEVSAQVVSKIFPPIIKLLFVCQSAKVSWFKSDDTIESASIPVRWDIRTVEVLLESIIVARIVHEVHDIQAVIDES